MVGIQWGNPKITVEKVPDPQMSSEQQKKTGMTDKQVSYRSRTGDAPCPINYPRGNDTLLNSAEREINEGKYYEAGWHLQKAEERGLSVVERNRFDNLKSMLFLKQYKDSIKQGILTKVGVITILNEKIRQGLIESGGKEYLIKEYKDDEYHKLKVGDKVEFRHINPNIAENVIYLTIYYEELKKLYSQHMNDDNEWLEAFLKSFNNSISLEEVLNDIENLKKSMCLERIGIIKSFDSENETGIIRCNGEEYPIKLEKDCSYRDFPNRSIEAGDRVSCFSTIENDCFYAKSVTWMENYYDILTKYYKYQAEMLCDNEIMQKFIQESKLAEKYEVTKEIILHDLREIQQREETEVQQIIMQLKQTNMSSK